MKTKPEAKPEVRDGTPTEDMPEVELRGAERGRYAGRFTLDSPVFFVDSASGDTRGEAVPGRLGDLAGVSRKRRAPAPGRRQNGKRKAS